MKNKNTFEELYAGYVVKEGKPLGNFVGPTDEMYRVALREMAVRFTKSQAMKHIQDHEQEGPFVIEDAVAVKQNEIREEHVPMSVRDKSNGLWGP